MKNYTQHIVLVSIDTLRADCINASPRAKGYLSQHKTKIDLRTDPLDRILKSGLYFNNFFSAAPYTSAAHAAYFTGMWPLNNGVYEFFNRKLSKPTIFEYAKGKGYRTIFQTDFPVILGNSLGFTEGIDDYFIEDENKAFKKLAENSKNNTLSFFHFGGVHYPYGFHTLKFGGKDYVNKVISLEKKYNISKKDRHKLKDILDETFRNKDDTEFLLRYKYIIEKLYSKRMYDDLFDLYLEGVNYFLQKRFKKFISNIKSFVDKNNAILFIFSDHGEEWDAHSEGHHNSLSDNILRVPLIVYGKQIKPRIEESLVRTIDLAPTIIELLPNSFEKIKMDGSNLNIFKPSGHKHAAKYAISQVWTSIATKKQIARYQKMTIKKNRYIRPLNTYLSGEAIRTKDKKLILYYRKNGSIIRKESSGNIALLSRILTNYNTSRIKGKNKIPIMELRMRNELRNLGYKV